MSRVKDFRTDFWRYSYRFDDLDLEFAGKYFFTTCEGCEYYGIGPKPMTRLAKEAGAFYKMGYRLVRIRRDLFEAYLREIYGKE